MEAEQNSFAINHLSTLSIVITSVIVTTLIIGGGMYVWSHQKQKALTIEILALQNQVNQLKQTAEMVVNNTKTQSDELIATRFQLAIQNFWGVKEVFQNPQDKNQFYYISSDSSGASIWVYDLSRDKSYQRDGTFNIPEGNTLLLNKQVAPNQEFRGVGFSDNKFVFTETSSENSPGPCFSPWFYQNLEYIDPGVTTPAAKPFTSSKDLLQTESQKTTNCQKNL